MHSILHMDKTGIPILKALGAGFELVQQHVLAWVHFMEASLVKQVVAPLEGAHVRPKELVSQGATIPKRALS
jgi:hypothetical protein